MEPAAKIGISLDDRISYGVFFPEVFGLFHKGDVDNSHLARHYRDDWRAALESFGP